MSIEEALKLIDHAFTANFGGNIPDAYMAPGVYRLWLDTLMAYRGYLFLKIAQEKNDMQQELLLEIDGRIDRL